MSPEATTIGAGGDSWSCSDEINSTNAANDAGNAGQSSRSSNRLTRSPSPSTPCSRVAHPLVPGVEVVDAIGHEHRQRGDEQDVADCTARCLRHHITFCLLHHQPRTTVEHSTVSAVDDDHGDIVELAHVTELHSTRRAGAGNALSGPRPQDVGPVVDGLQLLQEPILTDLAWGEIAEVLVAREVDLPFHRSCPQLH